MIDLDATRALATEVHAASAGAKTQVAIDAAATSAALLLACDEVASLRATVSRLNRRAQAAEATPPFEKTRARAQRDRHDAHRAELASLRAGLSEACDELADALGYLMPYHRAKWGYDATLARLRALLPSDAAPRATLDRMIPTLTEHAAAAHRALRPFGSRPWNDLSAEEQAELKSRVRACLDYVATTHGERDGNGTIYALGPTDPPPQVPPT